MLRDQISAITDRYDLPPAFLSELMAALAFAPPAAHTWRETLPGGAALDWTVDSTTSLAADGSLGEVGTSRYEDLGLLGAGGMGEVRRVRDRTLRRTLAMKLLRPELIGSPLVLRFVAEAQLTAQLQHPGILPVHEVGEDANGRLFYTMPEVQGHTFAAVIDVAYAEGAPSPPEQRHLVGLFGRVCEAVAYAHARGVIHRDLKPHNIMVGSHGEVLVVDWGLARIMGQPEHIAGVLEPLVTDHSEDGATATRMGVVTGTPGYMSPEQAAGEIGEVGPASDVYALGTILFRLLTGERPEGAGAGLVAMRVRLMAPGLPEELVAICLRAIRILPEERFADAGELSAALQDWLEGVKKRARALEVVARAEICAPEADALRARAATLRKDAVALLADQPTWAPAEQKVEGWEALDEAAALETEADLKAVQAEQFFQAALTHAPDLPEAHAALAERYRSQHAAAELARSDTMRLEVLLRAHASALPDDHPARTGHSAYLRGDGALTLATDPPGAEVLLHRYETHNRRLVPVFQRSLGCSPIVGESLPMGSYLCVLRHPERVAVRYPVCIDRGARWDGVPPEGGPPRPVWLPRREDLGPDDCYVPAGWFITGGDPNLLGRSAPGESVWMDGVILSRFPITLRQYLDFLDDLVARGREEEALRHALRERGTAPGRPGALMLPRDAGGHFQMPIPDEGALWTDDRPVLMVDWHGARAYAAWRAERTGLPWRLPGNLEWEKAARGVDGRYFPWGNFADPSWGRIKGSVRGNGWTASVDSYPVDESPYGARGMCGNVRDWCLDLHLASSTYIEGRRALPPAARDPDTREDRVLRGGSWFFIDMFARTALRYRSAPGRRNYDLGFRLARPAPGE